MSQHFCFHHSRADQLPEVQNLINYTAKTGASLGACRKYENFEPMLLKEFRSPFKFKMLKVCLFLLSSSLHVDAKALSKQLWFVDSDVPIFLPFHI